jgi:threonylcarbamoyladenosine tRNA methylthiotransferase MtaB
MEQIRQLSDNGYKEVVLTGIHLGGYGQDLQPRSDLTALVETIAGSRLVARLRLSSLDPREVPDRLLDLLAASDVVCPHLHICAQAGNDRILKAMRRNYDTSYYRDLLTRVRERLPEAALGSDIIVGFPGEDEAEFETALAYFASLPLTYFHVFPFSSRRTTAAASLPGHLAGMVKKERGRRMRELGAQKRRQFYARFVDRTVSILVEGKTDESTGLRRGFTRNYLPVKVAADCDLPNHEIDVRLTAIGNGYLKGELENTRRQRTGADAAAVST